MATADNLDELETWIGGILARLSPAERRKFARDQATALRRSQDERIGAQQNPDGSAFEKRKPQNRQPLRSKAGRLKRKAQAQTQPRAKPMFLKLRRTRFMAAESSEADIAVGFRSASTARIARVHQLGLVDKVTRAPDAPTAPYPKRTLLGFTEADRRRLLDAALALVAGGGK